MLFLTAHAGLDNIIYIYSGCTQDCTTLCIQLVQVDIWQNTTESYMFVIRSTQVSHKIVLGCTQNVLGCTQDVLRIVPGYVLKQSRWISDKIKLISALTTVIYQLYTIKVLYKVQYCTQNVLKSTIYCWNNLFRPYYIYIQSYKCISGDKQS